MPPICSLRNYIKNTHAQVSSLLVNYYLGKLFSTVWVYTTPFREEISSTLIWQSETPLATIHEQKTVISTFDGPPYLEVPCWSFVANIILPKLVLSKGVSPHLLKHRFLTGAHGPSWGSWRGSSGLIGIIKVNYFTIWTYLTGIQGSASGTCWNYKGLWIFFDF